MPTNVEPFTLKSENLVITKKEVGMDVKIPTFLLFEAETGYICDSIMYL